MAAGMHHADFFALIFTFHLRCERQIDGLDHRQGIHIGAQCHDGAGLAAHKHGNDAGLRHAGLDLEAKLLQMLRDHLCRAYLAITQFGMLMDVTPPGDDFRFDFFR